MNSNFFTRPYIKIKNHEKKFRYSFLISLLTAELTDERFLPGVSHAVQFKTLPGYKGLPRMTMFSD